MSDDLVFYTNPMSRGQIARWMLEETGAPYRTELLEYGTMDSDAYRAINPMAKVPAIQHGDRVVTECAAICAYLADAFPDAGLAPATIDRADYYRWLFFAAGPVEQAVTNRALGVEVPPEKTAMMGYGDFDRVVDVLDGWLATHDHVAGGRFTAADVYVGAQVIWGLGFGSLPKRASFEAYAARLTEREGYKRAKAADDALIAEMQEAAG
ncbi:glutathione S-transferase family protein [Sphingomonas qomolangmaensis]|uniref:Glutathione S-transferase family protein n=1 Tax=Sphingomonas qomolangmaensis TaxID=2918765 RepID=A0ABY5LAS4_9SPHN|nr:glutathione S-transferase family protein [Sphingomonas qomolangmaensis]UUL82894.1 glutathione S-transferase family protein [Sphingomonas qomolangmaensis]